MATEPVPDPDHHNFVMKELMRGYRVNGRVVRPSRVVIGAYQEGAPAAAAGGQVVDNATPEGPATEDADALEPSLEEIVAQAEAQLESGVMEPGNDHATEDDDEGEPS